MSTINTLWYINFTLTTIITSYILTLILSKQSYFTLIDPFAMFTIGISIILLISTLAR